MQAGAAIQRSHRFPAHLFVQIENLARLGDVPVSLIINELIECGLEAVRQQLPADQVEQLTWMTKGQSQRPMVSDYVEVGPKVTIRKVVSKLKPVKTK